MTSLVLPILYSFRRCPYAMRARMALAYAGVKCEIREILLRDKPAAMLEVSPKGTVPVLYFPDSGKVLEESLDVMNWAVSQKDPDGWTKQKQTELIAENDTTFKAALDRYKYPNRYEDVDPLKQRNQAEKFLMTLEKRLERHRYLTCDQITFTDVAIFPFVRQLARVEPDWFEKTPYKRVRRWLTWCLESPLFSTAMTKYPLWKKGAEPTTYP